MKKLLLPLFLLLATNCWAGYPNYTVTPAGQGGDFNTLAAAIADIVANHSTLSSPTTINISGTWASADTAWVNISGITTSAVNTLSIYTSGSAVHPGYYSDSSPYYRLTGTFGSSNSAINISANYVKITGIQLYNSYTSIGRGINISDGYQNVVLNRMILIGHDGALRHWNYTSTGCVYRNSVFITTTNGEPAVFGLSAFEVDNSVIINYGNQQAFTGTSATPLCKNCYAYSVGGVGFASSTETTSASNDGSNGTTTVAYATGSGAKFTNVSQGSENFTLTSGSSLIGAGTNLSGSFTDDIIGATRSTWDIGAFYFAAVTLPTVTTQAVSSIGTTTATGNGNLTATGGANATYEGVVYSTSPQSLPGNVAPGSSGYSGLANTGGSFTAGAFTQAMTGLSPVTTYYCRAYAQNSAGYSYGSEVSFTTSNYPTVTSRIW